MLGMAKQTGIIEEMHGVNLGDERRNRRAGELLARLADQPNGTLLAAMQGRVELAAAYRFLHNESIQAGEPMDAHVHASVERMKGFDRVLCVVDTSFIGYGHRAPVAGLGPHNRGQDNGFFVHPSFAVSTDGVCLGTVHWHSWVRDARLDKRKTQANRPVGEKESARWIQSLDAVAALQQRLAQTRLTYVADRESDFYELVARAQDKQVDFIIRAQSSRLLPDGRRLGQPPLGQRALGAINFEMAARPGRKARKVNQTVWSQRESLSARRGHVRTAGVETTVVWVHEQNPPAGEQPVCWMLLTNLPAETLEQAREIVNAYRLRWRIEMLFDALKNVCGIEDSQLRDAAALQKLCALHLIVAWCILHFKTLAREYPHLPATVAFTPVELKVLAQASPKAPADGALGTLHEAVIALAMLGGYLARKNDKPPGLKTLARAHERLCLLVAFHEKTNHTRCV